MNQKDIKFNLSTKGYCHIPFPNNIKIELLNEFSGKTLFTTAVKENPNSSRLLSSNKYVSPHTDHIAARYIAWHCQSQAAIGGESILIDGNEIIQNATIEILEYLKKIEIKNHRIFFDDKPRYSLLSNNNQTIYYAPFLCQQPFGNKEKQALNWFETQIQTANKIEIKLSEGDWLIINNHRMLHGRKSFQAGAGRILSRYWLSGSTII